jgi:hypothetical protein
MLQVHQFPIRPIPSRLAEKPPCFLRSLLAAPPRNLCASFGRYSRLRRESPPGPRREMLQVHQFPICPIPSRIAEKPSCFLRSLLAAPPRNLRASFDRSSRLRRESPPLVLVPVHPRGPAAKCCKCTNSPFVLFRHAPPRNLCASFDRSSRLRRESPPLVLVPVHPRGPAAKCCK